MTLVKDPQRRHSGAMARTGLVVTLLAALPAAGAAAAAQGQGGLFAPAEPPALRSAAAAQPDGITIRRREVTIDLGMLALSRAAASGPARRTSRRCR